MQYALQGLALTPVPWTKFSSDLNGWNFGLGNKLLGWYMFLWKLTILSYWVFTHISYDDSDQGKMSQFSHYQLIFKRSLMLSNMYRIHKTKMNILLIKKNKFWFKNSEPKRVLSEKGLCGEFHTKKSNGLVMFIR